MRSTRLVLGLGLGLTAGALLLAASLTAQTTAPKALAWDMPAPIASAAEAQALTYTAYLDGSTSGTTLTGVSCTGTTAPFACTAAPISLTAGSHTVRMTAGSGADVSAMSLVYTVVIVVIPPPQRIR